MKKEELVKGMSVEELQKMMTSYIKTKNRQKIQTFKDRELIRLAKRRSLDVDEEYLSAIEKFVKSL